MEIEENPIYDEDTGRMKIGSHTSFLYDETNDVFIPNVGYNYVYTKESVETLKKELDRYIEIMGNEWTLKRNYRETVRFMKEYYTDSSENFKRKKDKKAITSGYIYFLEGSGYVKIGKTNNLSNRIEQVGLLLPFKVTLIHSIKTDDIDSCEYYYHNLFKEKRTNGEWFLLNEEDILKIKNTYKETSKDR